METPEQKDVYKRQVLCGCNETGTFSEKKYTPVYVYLSTTPYVGESSMSDFVDYPSDLVRLGLRGTVKEVKTTSAAEMVQKFNEDGNLTSQGLWFDSSHRFGDEYKREYLSLIHILRFSVGKDRGIRSSDQLSA